MTGPVGIGLIGTGMISKTYLDHLTRFPDVRVLVLGDLDTDRARAQAEKHGVAEWGGGQALVAQANEAGLLVGVAPDTVLGPGLQTARRLIARGDIGEPLSAQTVIQYPGPELFHPNPEFLFATGAGPLYDVGPYYLTTLVHLFGPFARVAVVGSTARARRTIQVGDHAGTDFPVAARASSPGEASGALDMARCIRSGGRPAASGELAYHVLDAMIAMDESITSGRMIDVTSTVAPIPLMDASWDPFASTLATDERIG